MLNELIPRQELRRVNLREQATKVLRDFIISGRIPPGSKIVEREVAALLGISRAPARDALMDLEKEGLIISQLDARYVIDPNEQDIEELHQVRSLLERFAVELAAHNTSEENQIALNDALTQMEDAVSKRDYAEFTKSDVQTHELIWMQSENIHLQRALHSILGPMFVCISRNAENFDWDDTLHLHRDLIECINRGDAPGALESLERHIESSLTRSLHFFKSNEEKS